MPVHVYTFSHSLAAEYAQLALPDTTVLARYALRASLGTVVG